MKYENGTITNDAGTQVPLTPAITAMLAAVTPDFGTYAYIDLTTGEKQKSGIIAGQPVAPVVDSAVTGMNVAISAEPSFLAEEVLAIEADAQENALSLSNAIVSVMSGNIDASAGITMPTSDGPSVFIMSPVPAVAANGSAMITIPESSQIIGVSGVVESLTGGITFGIGAASGAGQGIAWEASGTILILASEIVATKSSGYVAVAFIP